MNSLSSTLLNTFLILIILWFIILVIAIISLAKRKDMLMPVKIFWSAVLFIAPVVGLIFYLLYGTRRNRGLTKL